jgi:hypothetical protein
VNSLARPAVRRRLPPASLQPLRGLLDDVAIVEHARYGDADPASGHCVDDAGRALVLACELSSDAIAGDLARRMVEFLDAMHLGGGRFRLRDNDRTGADTESDDGSARAIHGLGVAAGSAPWAWVRDQSRRLLADATPFRSPHLRARAHAALGAAAAGPQRPEGLDAQIEAMAVAVGPLPSGSWPWPEARLTYSNAIVPDSLIAVAAELGDDALLDRGLELLAWLLTVESRPGHLSPVPVGGWASGERRPGFDQQPVEAGTLAAACRRAIDVTGDEQWGRGIELAAGWFAGVNDVGVPVWNPATGRAYDGLEPDSINQNQGAESALAFVSTCADLDWLERRAERTRRSTR